MKKHKGMTENTIPRDHTEYVKILNTIKKRVKEDIRKYNLDEIREKM